MDVDKNTYLFSDVPHYIIPSFNTSSKTVKVITLNTHMGSMINLKNYKNLDEYLKTNFSGKSRYEFRNYKKRIAKCFPISYKVYYGNIDKKEYDRLFTIFPEMIKKRFDSLGVEHYALDIWDNYEENGFSLINEKRACLFVIYDRGIPISIAFNPILNKTLYGYMRSYDINYSKFYLGFIDLIWQLEWCFENNIEVFDLLKGTYSYKSKFTDSTYFFQKHIVYNSKSIVSISIAAMYSIKLKSFYYIIKLLKKCSVDTVYHHYKQRKEKSKLTPKNKSYISTEIDYETNLFDSLSTIDINKEAYSFLRKPIYDCIYTAKESINSVLVYKNNNAYILKGEKKCYLITTAETL
ncbi:GNAT family N-acetyltransferase [Cellulophaga sp. F20128]|uniref:GNAT family N-acetyltransferase n=1 Tax=Cellulophaga sp. F20128 TaxID=2926413 RepID=UPI001FF41E6F|nr:GNAT family N-acetyltransferase [Cellulophaga sp. F20128]MCK0156867.1 GNAT family N-acetyltransferase [Cellulophaga sp. F20128]